MACPQPPNHSPNSSYKSLLKRQISSCLFRGTIFSFKFFYGSYCHLEENLNSHQVLHGLHNLRSLTPQFPLLLPIPLVTEFQLYCPSFPGMRLVCSHLVSCRKCSSTRSQFNATSQAFPDTYCEPLFHSVTSLFYFLHSRHQSLKLFICYLYFCPSVSFVTTVSPVLTVPDS